MSLRDKPTLRDWVGAGLRSLAIAEDIRGWIVYREDVSPSEYFRDANAKGEDWINHVGLFSRWLVKHATDHVVVESYWDGKDDGDRPVLARVAGFEVGWVGDGRDWRVSKGAVFFHKRDEEALPRALGELLWQDLGSSHASLFAGSLAHDDIDAKEFRPTRLLQELRNRIAAFHAAGEARGLMLNGMPGTGKSLGARYLARELGARTLRSDLRTFQFDVNRQKEFLHLASVIAIFRPDVLIIDDVDRSNEHTSMEQLLGFFEQAMAVCKLVIVTVNCPNRMLGALMRPGRIDDIVEVGALDRDVVITMLAEVGPEHVDLANQLDGLPAAYVADFVKRLKALGRAKAEAEIPELLRHAEMVKQMTEREDVFEED